MTIKTEVFEALKEHGPLDINQLQEKVRAKVPKVNSNSVEARLWDLRQEGYVAMGEDKLYQVTAETAPPEGYQPRNGRRPVTQERPSEDTDSLTGDQEKFQELLRDCSVTKGIKPITEMFFSGDPEDLENLVQVLEDARAHIAPLQKRMIVRYWARYTQHWPLPSNLEERLNQDGRSGSSDPKSPGSEFMEDLGWKIEKDRDGEWIPRPSGDLTYSHALKWAATMNASRPTAEREEDPEEDTPTRGRKRGARQEDSVLAKLLDRAFPERDERDDTIKALERRLDDQDRARQDDRMERLETMMAAALNRNPMAEYMEFQTQLQALGLGGGSQQHVTDTSPTVQLVKDQSDKLDKNMNRVVGVLERLVLRDHNTLATEESSSTPKEQEEKAAELLGKMRQGTRSKALRTKLWGEQNA